MGSKKWYQSKGCWIGIVTVSVGVLEIVQQFLEGGDYSVTGISVAVLGILKVAERFSRGSSSVVL